MSHFEFVNLINLFDKICGVNSVNVIPVKNTIPYGITIDL